ncbi:uncharacterized protein LOC133305089 [Gastrolobium bilobum]|uniref:uncharacterized protein LOC133305089 n=1 Tax=Gastrolobium bilobum TaxID=150636 RepID=UPI002AB03739|nr:uncharacterized protein LOC133305089 [Gastrolobium bilobum]
MAEPQKSLVIKLYMNGAKRSGTVQEGCQQMDIADFRYKKMRNKASEISPPLEKNRTTKHPPNKSFIKENSGRMSTAASQVCDLENEGAGCKKEKKKRAYNMDRNNKMQCWVILQRLMVERNSWAFKQRLDVMVFEFLDNPEAVS